MATGETVRAETRDEGMRQHGARELEAARLRWGACGDIEERLEGEALAPGLCSSYLSGRGTFDQEGVRIGAAF